jgi:hypothetical protein
MEKFTGDLCIEGLNLNPVMNHYILVDSIMINKNILYCLNPYSGFESLGFSRFLDNRIFRTLHHWLLKACLQS